jgi:hypothetical protein
MVLSQGMTAWWRNRQSGAKGCGGNLVSSSSRRNRMKGTYSSKEFRVTPARSHSEQGSIRIFVCVCPSNASAMDQRDRVFDWPGARRAVTCATITSNKDLGAVADGNPSIWLFQENCRRSENCRQEVGACVCPIGESTGKFGFAYSTAGLLRGPSKKRRYGCSLSWTSVDEHRDDHSSVSPQNIRFLPLQ